MPIKELVCLFSQILNYEEAVKLEKRIPFSDEEISCIDKKFKIKILNNNVN